ncbi:hypothetical protein A2U01_0099922, partial [Trifolium medium]|nr:hypothetical protein [Trifolium medium]
AGAAATTIIAIIVWVYKKHNKNMRANLNLENAEEIATNEIQLGSQLNVQVVEEDTNDE